MFVITGLDHIGPEYKASLVKDITLKEPIITIIEVVYLDSLSVVTTNIFHCLNLVK